MNEVNRDVKAAWLAGGKVYQMMSPVMSQMQDFIRQDEEALSSHWGFSRRGMQINTVDANCKGVLAVQCSAPVRRARAVPPVRPLALGAATRT